MRLFTGSLLVLLFVANSVYGQLTSIEVDGSAMPGVDVSNVLIDDQGVMIITSKNGDYEINKIVTDGDVAINSFRINKQTTTIVTTAGTAATVSWATSDAVSCSAATEPADQLGGWTSTTNITKSGSLSVKFPQSGVFNLKLECLGLNGSIASEMVTAKVGAASITSFNVSPDSADSGSDVSLTLSWTSANTSGGCFGSWTLDNLPSTGSRFVNVTNIQSDTDYTLTCINEFDEVDSTVSVTVIDTAPACNVKLTSKIIRNWGSVFGSDWPAPSSRQLRISVPDTGYYAIRFETGDIVDYGALSTFEASGTSGARLGAVSEIAGCFDVAKECQYQWGRSGGILWDTSGTVGGCQLKPNTAYYFNVTFTNGVSPTSSTCLGTFCETYVRVTNPD